VVVVVVEAGLNSVLSRLLRRARFQYIVAGYSPLSETVTMTEQEIRDVIHHAVEESVKRSVDQLFEKLFLNPDDIESLKLDFVWTRSARKTAEVANRYVFVTVLAGLLSGLGYLIVIGINSIMGK
jgi:hypothetical protein